MHNLPIHTLLRLLALLALCSAVLAAAALAQDQPAPRPGVPESDFTNAQRVEGWRADLKALALEPSLLIKRVVPKAGLAIVPVTLPGRPVTGAVAKVLRAQVGHHLTEGLQGERPVQLPKCLDEPA